MRVKDERKSKSFFVMKRIRGETFSSTRVCRLLSGVLGTREFEKPSKKGRQMIMQNAISHDKAAALSAPFDRNGAWTHMNWRKCQYAVRRLQMRIVLAMQQGRWGKVKSLQRLLTYSFSAKALAVKHVTENTGKRTPGVDGQVWSSVERKYRAVSSLKTLMVRAW